MNAPLNAAPRVSAFVTPSVPDEAARQRIRALVTDPAFRERLFLVTRGIPSCVAAAIEPEIRAALCRAIQALPLDPAAPEPIDPATLGERLAAFGVSLSVLAGAIGETGPLCDILSGDYTVRAQAGADVPEQDAAVAAWLDVAEPVVARFIGEYRDLNTLLAAAL